VGSYAASVEGFDSKRGCGRCGGYFHAVGVSRGAALALGSGAGGSARGLKPPSASAEAAVVVRDTGKANKQNVTVQTLSNRTAKQTQRAKAWSALSASMHKWMTKKSGGGAVPTGNAPAPMVGGAAGVGNVPAVPRPSPQGPLGLLPTIISDEDVPQPSLPPTGGGVPLGCPLLAQGGGTRGVSGGLGLPLVTRCDSTGEAAPLHRRGELLGPPS
jgi:hypothetical protein